MKRRHKYLWLPALLLVWLILLVSVQAAMRSAGAYFLSLKTNASVLVEAAERADWPQVRSLIVRHADVNSRDERDHTALMYAAFYGKADIVDALLARGAAVNAVDKIGCTAMMWAQTNGRPGDRHVVALLRQAGAKE